jgi:hypothetical protein
VLDLKPWLAKFSYSIGLDVLYHITCAHVHLSCLLCSAQVLDLKPWLAKFSYSIGLDVLAANAMDDSRDEQHPPTDRDRAVFSMLFQRSAGAEEKPDRVMWQVRMRAVE